MNTKKKIIIGVIVVLAIMIFIDLVIKQPWKSDSFNQVENNYIEVTDDIDGIEDDLDLELGEVEELDEIDDIDEHEEDANEGDDNIELPYFLEERNEYRDLYLNGEYSREVFEIGKGELSSEDKRDIINTLNLLSKVVHLGADKTTLYDHIESVKSEEVTDSRFNGFVNSMEEMPEYGIWSSFQLSENVYQVQIHLSEVMGDGTAGHVQRAVRIPVTYNTETKLLSFKETIQRHPVDAVYTNEAFTVHAYMMESTTELTKIYLAITNNGDRGVGFGTMPQVSVSIVKLDGSEGKVMLNTFRTSSSEEVFSDKPLYTFATVRAMFDTITGIEFIVDE